MRQIFMAKITYPVFTCDIIKLSWELSREVP